MRAIALLSGGLDSTLAAKVILEQGIEMEALHFLTVFCSCSRLEEDGLASKKAGEALGIRLTVLNVSAEFLKVVKHPGHGYGRNLNPCIDCRILMLKKAKEYMTALGGAFLVTGEVLGQRPLSQRRNAMRLIEKEADLEGLILRPLSAKFLPETVPEVRGWVHRERLLDISGRSRRPQIKLAEQYGIRDYPCPAGGCLLTDPGFSRRLKDLMVHDPHFSLHDVHLLKFGRHFRLSPTLKLIVGRHEQDNRDIQAFAQKGDVLMKVSCYPGPLSLLRGEADQGTAGIAAAMTVRYSQGKRLSTVEVDCRKVGEDVRQSIHVSPFPDWKIKDLMIGQ